jgi:hypothetical protein
MSSVDYQQPECTDISGHGYHLQAAAALGNVTYGYFIGARPLVPVARFQGAANQYLFRADGGAGNWADITGAEAQTGGMGLRGLSLEGWFYDAALSGVLEYLMAKDDGANQQYRLVKGAGNALTFQVWPGPVSVTSAATLRVGWNHVAGIYDQPSQTLYVVLNDIVTPGVGGAAPVALADTAAPFTIGADGAGANRFTGYASMCSLEACSLSQGGLATTVRSLFHQSRSMLGV